VAKQQTFDAIEMSGAFADQTLPLPVRAAGIFLLDRWHPHDSADMAFSAIDRDQGSQERQDINPISFDAPGTTIDLDAGGIEHATFDTNSCQFSREPKAVVSGLITYDESAIISRRRT